MVRDAADHTKTVHMRSHYFLIKKEWSTSYLKRKMILTMFGGDMRMLRSYNRHGREQNKVVQLTCDAEVEKDFLIAMIRERIQQLPWSYDSMRLTLDHPTRGEGRWCIERYHAELVLSQ